MRRLWPSAVLLIAFSLSSCGGGSGSSSGSGGGGNNPPPPIQGSASTIDFGNTHQTIRGFGGSDAWIGMSGTAEANVLFGTGTGQIGLSILRARIDPSSTTAGSQWDGEVASAQMAIAAGSNVSIIATPWTPPPTWKINIPDTTNPVAEGSLDPNNYANYANYLESFVTYMANHNVSLYAISMQNEPDATVTYESCVWTPQQMDTWVANYGSVLTTKLMMPESQNFTQSYADPTLNDQIAAPKVAIVAGHTYGVSPAPYPLATQQGKEVWMTEHYLNMTGAQPAIGDALNAAIDIHNSLTVGQYNAYVWWWVSDVPSLNSFIGLIDANNNIKPAGAGMAQFSRFIRPGYVRVDATNGTSGVYISAYKGNGHFVMVAINTNTNLVNQPFTIQNQSLTSLTPYQTTSTSTVAAQSPVAVSGNQFTYALPAQSVTTFVQ